MPAALGGGLHTQSGKTQAARLEGPGRTNSEASPSSPNERRMRMSHTSLNSQDQADPRLAEHAAEIRRLYKRGVGDVTEIGRRLSECKKLVGHGNWLTFLEREFGW